MDLRCARCGQTEEHQQVSHHEAGTAWRVCVVLLTVCLLLQAIRRVLENDQARQQEHAAIAADNEVKYQSQIKQQKRALLATMCQREITST